MLRGSTLSYYLRCPHTLGALGQVLTILRTHQLPANRPQVATGSSAWTPTTHQRDPSGVPGSRLWPGQALWLLWACMQRETPDAKCFSFLLSEKGSIHRNVYLLTQNNLPLETLPEKGSQKEKLAKMFPVMLQASTCSGQGSCHCRRTPLPRMCVLDRRASQQS